MSGRRGDGGEPPVDLSSDLAAGDLTPTAALLREVLQREGDRVTPSPDGFAGIQERIDRQRPRTRRALGRRLVPVLAAASLVAVGAGAAVVQSVTNRRADAPVVGGSVRLVDSEDVRATPRSALPVYVVARQNGRLVLFREFHQHAGDGDAAGQVAAAVRIALTEGPRDADDVRLFAPGEPPVVRVTLTPSLVSVDVRPAPRPARATPTREEATAAVQQLVWTATAAAAVATAPAGAPSAGTGTRAVRLTVDGRSTPLFGLVPLDRDLDRQFGGDARARAWVIEPAEGAQRPAGGLQATGDAVAGRAGTVHVRLVRDGRTVREQDVPLAPPEGATGPLRPGQRGTWRVTGWDVTPGAYRVEVAATDDDGRTWTDTKAFTVR